MTAGCRHRWPPVVLRGPLGRWTGGPECCVCTHSLENGLTPTGRAVDVFKVMEKQVSLSLALRAPAEPGRRSQTRETAEQASAGQVVGRLLCLSLDVSRQPGPGMQNEKQHWERLGLSTSGPMVRTAEDGRAAGRHAVGAPCARMGRAQSMWPGSCVHVEGKPHQHT